jgi:hypothetical protein
MNLRETKQILTFHGKVVYPPKKSYSILWFLPMLLLLLLSNDYYASYQLSLNASGPKPLAADEGSQVLGGSNAGGSKGGTGGVKGTGGQGNGGTNTGGVLGRGGVNTVGGSIGFGGRTGGGGVGGTPTSNQYNPLILGYRLLIKFVLS